MNKKKGLGLAQFGFLGLLVHALGIWVFILVSKSAPALGWKLLIIGSTGIAAAALLWIAIKRSRTIMSAITCSAVLAVDFEVAFHLVGLLGFGGLLRDATSFSYLLALLGAMGVIFIIYLVPALAMRWVVASQNGQYASS